MHKKVICLPLKPDLIISVEKYSIYTILVNKKNITYSQKVILKLKNNTGYVKNHL